MKNVLDIQTIKATILEAVQASSRKLTPLEIEKTIRQKRVVSRQKIKAAIRDLISTGDLAYTNIFGSSFIEKSFNRPVRISKKIVIKPYQVSYHGGPEEVVVQLAHGVSFGTGEHPSTRLALRIIEYALSDGGFAGDKRNARALDIGTGSGILAISAVLLGIGTAVGIDIDPCAISEAKANVKINGLSNRIKILRQPLEHTRQTFSLVIANLRYPSLKKIYPFIKQIAGEGSWIIISGIKIQETSDFLNCYAEDAFGVVWHNTEKGWIGFALKRN
jgi:ribosomal protein L11 methyltransferase